MKNDTYFNIFVPIVSALLGAIIGSISTHILKWIEDNRTEIKKTGRKIYYKIFPELKYFFLCDNTSEKPSFSKLKVNEMKKRIENILEENIDFLDKKLFSIYYYNLKSDEYYESLGYSEFININHLEVFSKILMCMHSVFKKPSMIDKKLLKDVDELIYCYKTWFLLMDKFQDWTLVDNILQGRCLFKKTFKEIYGNKLFHKLLKCENVDDDEFYEIFSKYCIDEISIPKKIFTKNKYLNIEG
jgi:hypothetical protein